MIPLCHAPVLVFIAQSLGAGVLIGQQSPGPDTAADSLRAAAARAIDSGRPWQATRLLAPLTRDGAGSPALVLTAARAAVQWQGWSTVIRLLPASGRWLDTQDDGEGRALLGRSLLERGEPALALRQTQRAVSAATDATKGERLVIHARALDRLGQHDSAATTYRAAAGLLPAIADWLNLRAAGVMADSAARGRLYSSISIPAARARVPWTEALALDRQGDWRGAADRYAALGARMAALRLRLSQGDPATRRAARNALTALLRTGLAPDEIVDAIQLFDRHASAQSPADELVLARRAAAVGRSERAARGYAAAARLMTDRDRLNYATILARLDRVDEALALFDGVNSASLKADAAYQKARLRVRSGRPESAYAALRSIPRTFPDDAVPASSALFLLGDLYADRGIDDSARVLFLEAFTRYPDTPFGRRAGFQAAMIAYVDRDYAAAVSEFDRFAAVAGGEDAAGAGYWAGKALLARGDTAAAQARWRRILSGPRESYYAWRATQRLGTPFWQFAAADQVPAAAPEALGRVRQLASLGMDVEARFELDGLDGRAGGAADRGLGIATALAQGDWPARALRIAQRASARGAPFGRPLMELLYPLPFREVLVAEARQAGVDPMLVAGIVRQESTFDPVARSPANARGLMQVLPSVGTAMARRTGLPEWDPVLLYQPDVNLNLGIEHLAEGLKRLGWPERALAAYNAGEAPVGRWQAIRGVADDPEVFVERIPFSETRDYVRRVLRNYAVYSALYPSPGT